MKNFLILMMIASFLICCGSDEELTFTPISYTDEELPSCKNQACPQIDISLLKADANSELARILNDSIEAKVVSRLVISVEDEKKIKTLGGGLANFIDSFQEFRSDFPGEEAVYEISLNTEISFENSLFLSIVFDSYSYWGGAHGYGSTTFINVDKETAEVLTNDQLFSDKKGFTDLAEIRFREQENIPPGENINSRGYFFPDDNFILPENIGFTKEYVFLIYNPYEVASYADGQIVIEIPVEEVRAMLRPNLKPS